MNILIFYDEYNCLDCGFDDDDTFSLKNFSQRICVFFNKLADDNNIKIIVPESMTNFYKTENKYYETRGDIDVELLETFFKKVSISTISNEEFVDCFDSKMSTIDIYKNDLSGNYTDYTKIKKLLNTKIGDFQPDFIICYPYQSNYIRSIYKKKLILNFENAIFSRLPLPLSLYFDPFGSIKNNFLIEFKDKIRNFVISKEENQQVEQFKSDFKEYFEKYYNCEDLIKPYRQKFKKIILVPLIAPLKINGLSDFADDMSVFLHVIRNIPKDIGVIFTYHLGTKNFSKAFLSYMYNKYENIIHIPELQKWNMASTALFPYVDAVINQASMTGVMAMLWDLPVISLDCSYNDWYCDSKNLGDLLDILGKGKVNKNNIIFWYLTRYALFDKRYDDSEFLENYFKNKFKKFDKGIKFDFYEEIEKFNDISDYILKKLNRETEKQRNRETDFYSEDFFYN